MAFALTSYRARGLQIAGAQPDRAIQQVVMTITGAVTDVALDIGTDAGTFWVAAVADATYGTLATSAKENLLNIVAVSQALAGLFVPELVGRLKAAAASTTDYTLSVALKRPIYTFAASNGELLYTVFLEYLLNPSIMPIDVCFGVSPA